MLEGLFLLLGLSLVMALASFLAGALPLSMSLSQSQLRLISTIGMGVLVGTSLIVIIPEGIETVYSSEKPGHTEGKRGLGRSFNAVRDIQWANGASHASPVDDIAKRVPQLQTRANDEIDPFKALPGPVIPAGDIVPSVESPTGDKGEMHTWETTTPPTEEAKHTEPEPPTFYIGLSLILGFILMFLIDKLPRHASDTFQQPAPPRHISLNNLSESAPEEEGEESESFLQSLTPSPKQRKSLATTTGLVIHAAADGIAMGASSSTSNTKLGFIIFVAIMLHKAPAAFGLTSVLLKQGLSKRAARGHLIIFSLAAPFGAIVTFFIIHLLGGGAIEGEAGQWWTGMLLLFSAGTFLYVAMHAMQEDNPAHDHSTSNGYVEGGPTSQRKPPRPQMRDTFAAVGGMLLPLITQLGSHH